MKTYRELEFENEHVCVWKTVISPNQPVEMHRHRIVIGLKGGKLQRLEKDEGKEPVEAIIIDMKQPQDRPLPSKPID